MSHRFLITSALPYVNGIKHLGNLVGSLLPADVHARFHRQIGSEILFICATDEHGTPTEIAAARAGQSPENFCKIQHARQAEVYRRFGLSFDYFGRSSAASNRALTQHFYHRLNDAGLIVERNVPQVWSQEDGRYLPDRYVLGICPHCGDASARGDQCDACGSLLDPEELIAPRSALSGSTHLEIHDSLHLFLAIRPARCAETLARHTGRVATLCQRAGTELAYERSERPLHHAGSCLGRASAKGRLHRQGLLCLVRCAHRLHRGNAGLGSGGGTRLADLVVG